MTEADNVVRPLHFGSDSADIQIRIQINGATTLREIDRSDYTHVASVINPNLEGIIVIIIIFTSSSQCLARYCLALLTFCTSRNITGKRLQQH